MSVRDWSGKLSRIAGSLRSTRFPDLKGALAKGALAVKRLPDVKRSVEFEWLPALKRRARRLSDLERLRADLGQAFANRRSPGVRTLAVVVGAALLLPASGLAVEPQAATPAPTSPAPETVQAVVARSTAAARVKISPRDGARGVRPDRGVEVKVADGKLTEVTLKSKGREVAGDLSPDRTSWRTRWALAPGRSYQVRTTATGSDGQTVTATSKFTTLEATETIAISDVTPSEGETVGVGMPIIVTFDRPVHNKGQVERALEVRSSEPGQGAWRWVSDTQVIFRTKKYWAAKQEISLTAHLTGVRAAKGVYGLNDHKLKFKVGDANISKVNVKTHRMVVTRNGKKVKDVGISAGRGGTRSFTTTSGVHAVMRKASPVVMTSGWMGITDPSHPEYYKLTVYSAVQISSSGEYVHSAPWSVWAQGRQNVSHGCVNAAPDFAAWYYDISQRGDIVTVTGTDRELEWNNGYGYWQLSWKEWTKGSALKRPAMTTGEAPTATAPPTSQAPTRD